MSALGHSLRLSSIDVSRMLHKHMDWRASTSALAGALTYVVLVAGVTLSGGYLGYRMGTAFVSSEGLLGLGAFDVAIARGVIALFWLIFTLVIAARAIGQRGTLAQPEGILTVVPTNQALLGVLLAEYAYVLLWTIVPAIGIGAGFSVGTGALSPLLTVPLAIAAAGAAAVGLGYPLGLAIRHVASRFAFVARHKGLIILAVFGAYFVALASGAWNNLMVQLFEPMQQAPVGWYADLLFVGTPGVTASSLYAGGALAGTVVVAVLGTAAGTWVAERHWFSDPVLAGVEQSTTETDAAPGFERRLEPVVGPATAALVTLSWRRARRSPLKLLYAFYPLLLLAGLFASIVQSGAIPAYLPYAVLVFVAWAAGVIFTLNPLGDQGAALASTLLSRVDGRTFVRAHLVAGLVVAIPLGMLATAIVAVLSPVDGTTALVLVAAAPVVMIVSAGLSVGIGMAFPRFEATNVTKSMKTVLPSRWAFLLFSAHLFATAGAAAVVYEPLVREAAAGLLSRVLPFGLAVSADTLYVVTAVALVVLVLSPVVAYRYAVQRFDHYTLA